MVDSKKRLKKILIAAVSKNGIIGNEGKIPWHSKEELNHFKNTTLNSTVIFGRKTFLSLKRPLKNRTNIVISRTHKLNSTKDILVFPSLKNAYRYLIKKETDKVFICGGYQLYRSSLKSLDEMIITEMKLTIEGDTKFPKLNYSNWNLVKVNKYKEFDVKFYQRKKIQ